MNKTRGMTLLEVLAAMVVFAVAALAVMNSTGEQIRGLSYIEQKTLAGWVADNQLVKTLVEQPWPPESWYSGESELAGRTWHWRWRGIQTTNENIRGLEVEVRSQSEDETPLSTLRTYVIKP